MKRVSKGIKIIAAIGRMGAFTALALSGCLIFATSSRSANLNAVWDGTTGNWSEATKWSTNPLVPNNGNGDETFVVTIDSGNVLVDVAATIEQYSQDGGVVTVSGAGRELIVNGQSVLADEASGTARIQSGGKVQFNDFVYLGRLGYGFVEIEGGVFETNSATLGSALLSGIFVVDEGAGAVSIEGIGSHWIDHGTITLGAGGFGEISVTGGGNVTGDGVRVGSRRSNFIAYWPGNGEVTVSGVNSLLTARFMFVGDAGYGDVSVHDQGTIDATSFYVYPRGSVLLQGGTINASSSFWINNGSLYGYGTVRGTVESEGRIAPGQSSAAGILGIDGSLTLRSTAESVFDLGGNTAGVNYDLIVVTGDLALGGNLFVSFRDGFESRVSPLDTFTLIVDVGTTSSVTGTFLNVANNTRLTTTDGVGSFIVHYGTDSAFDPKRVVLTDFLLAGDFNGDGTVDAADYVLWRKGVGVAPTPANYNHWRAHFGETFGNGSGATANVTVPEPATLVMLIMVAAASIPLRRRRIT